MFLLSMQRIVTMKSAAYFLVVGVLYLSSCKSNDDIPKATPAPIPFSVINGDNSDINLSNAFGWDIEVEGSFSVEENYFYDQQKQFSLNGRLYEAQYKGNGIFNSRVYNRYMCTLSSCDTAAFLGSGVWQSAGVLPQNPQVNWEFINPEKTQGYRVEVTQLPKQVQILSKPEVLATGQDNILYFSKSSPADSVYFSLVIIPKNNLPKWTSSNPIHTQFIYPFTAQADQIVIPGEQLFKPNEIPAASDSVFINMVSVKRVVKIIEGKKIGITYKVNNLQPIIVR